jgi:hypothetical protein
MMQFLYKFLFLSSLIKMINSTRSYWSDMCYKVCFPILDALSQRRLKLVFIDKKPTAHLEAFCRVLVGIAPCIELGDNSDNNSDNDKSGTLRRLSLLCIDSLTNPNSADYIDFTIHEQVLVEAGILCLALSRGYSKIWCSLSQEVKSQVIQSLKRTRTFIAHDNNWVLFPSMIEAFLLKTGENKDIKYNRLWEGINIYKDLYKGDGMYGDGKELHLDYYNSYVIHPILLEILSILKDKNMNNDDMYKLHKKRLQRWAVTQERMISVDGTFPPIGRSLTYRCGAFHGLALNVYIEDLHNTLKPGQVRVALTRVIRATLEHPDTFQENGWLTKGLFGNQPSLAEPYINHGSLYLCSSIFLPLGLPTTCPFWTDDDEPTTWDKILNSDNVTRDKPYVECVRKIGKCV